MNCFSVSSRAGRGLVSGLTGASLMFTLLGSGAIAPQPAAADSFANGAFRRVWERSDVPVAQGKAPRSWLWGNVPYVAQQEKYAQGPGGTRLVQYFDKSRMEINDPYGDPSSPWYVTNGLLVVEMMTGRVQVGNAEFENAAPSWVPVAGDTTDLQQPAPSYASLARVASLHNDNTAAQAAAGSPVRDRIDHDGNVEHDSPTAPRDLAHVATYAAQTRHNIPDVFWRFLNSSGLVFENGQLQNGRLMDWVFVMGYPITEAYWTTIRVGGLDRQVLVQAYQRRILTYSPDNPEGWKVEMGNVGRHYYTWRYEHPTCSAVPVRGFGTVWANHHELANAIGCAQPWSGEQTVPTAVERFEHGTMLYVGATNSYPFGNKSIFVLFDDGTYQHFDDTYVEGKPNACSPIPPVGLRVPVRGFNKVWCEGTGAKVRERLGWAIEPEKGADGAWQAFEHGIMFWSGATNQVFALLNTQFYAAGDRRWVDYVDTFKP